MFFAEDIWPLILPDGFTDKTQALSVSLLQTISDSMTTSTCGDSDFDLCRDDSTAFTLKLIAMASILIAGVAGIAIPIYGRHLNFLKTDSNLFVAAKAFAAGVILSTGFVHMLSGGSSALTSPCLPKFPWSKFPFPGFFAMIAALVTLLVHFVGTQYYERKQGLNRLHEEQSQVGESDAGLRSEIAPAMEVKECNEKVFGEEADGGMHIAGMHAHAARHRHSHPHGKEACEGNSRMQLSHNHGHGHGRDDESNIRHVVVSQILELGIVSHSVIIGLSLGVSQSPCTIRPLIGALSFHQFFEGLALGGCISEAQFNPKSATIVACFFAVTTPIGIGAGTAMASLYNPLSAGALVAEGILDSLSAGILVYMALVDLIAADFMSKRMRCNFRLREVSYFMLFLGAGLMSLLAIWA